MKVSELKHKLASNKVMSSITIRMPENVVSDLKDIAPLLGFSGYQPLIRSYVGKGLRADLEKLEDSNLSRFIEALKHQGVEEGCIQKAIEELVA
jgi:hypothetical protein